MSYSWNNFRHDAKWGVFTALNFFSDTHRTLSSPRFIEALRERKDSTKFQDSLTIDRNFEFDFKNSVSEFIDNHQRNPFAEKNQAISERLSNNTKMKTALELPPRLEEIKQTLDESINFLKTQVKDHDLHPEAVSSRFLELKSETEELIKAQNQKEITAMESITDPEWRTILNKGGDSDIEEIKNEKISQLKEKHAADLSKFSNSMNESINEIGNEAEITNRKYNAIDRYKENRRMRELLDSIPKSKPPSEGGDGVEVEIDGNFAKFKGIDIAKLPFIYSITGKKISQDAQGNLSMDMPNRWNIFYYKSASQNTKADLMSLALEIRDRGHKGITMSISNSKPEVAMELAREAYDACREAGFSRDNTKIKVNGNEMEIKEIFKGHEGRLADINDRAEKADTTKSAKNPKSGKSPESESVAPPTSSHKSSERLKEAMAGVRQQHQTASEAATRTNNSNPAP